jgi:hypothetical protein
VLLVVAATGEVSALASSLAGNHRTLGIERAAGFVGQPPFFIRCC